jgi:hypothetical protein
MNTKDSIKYFSGYSLESDKLSYNILDNQLEFMENIFYEKLNEQSKQNQELMLKLDEQVKLNSELCKRLFELK